MNGISLPSQDVTITGNGKLSIETTMSQQDANNFHTQTGIRVKALSIEDAQITILGSGIQGNSDCGIYFSRSCQMKDAALSIQHMIDGINGSEYYQIFTIDHTHISMQNIEFGILLNPTRQIPVTKFHNSDMSITSGNTSLNLTNGANISNTKIVAISQQGNAIYSEGNLNIDNHSELNLKGKWCAIQCRGDELNIDNSQIIGHSTEDAAIFTSGHLTIQNNSYIQVQGYLCGLQSNQDLQMK